MSRRCVFCGGPGVTLEHVWPQWLRRDPSTRFWAEQKYATDEKHHIELRSKTAFGVIQERLVPRGNRIPTLNITVKVVCAACNNGWMSALEGQARRYISALMTGRALVLNQAALGTISAWAFKTAAMFQHNDAGSRTVTPSALAAFMTEGLPPAGSRVYLFNQLDSFHAMTMSHESAKEIDANTGRPFPSHNASVTAMMLPRVGFLVTFCTDRDEGRRVNGEHRLTEIWPRTPRTVRWPTTPMDSASVTRLLEVVASSGLS